MSGPKVSVIVPVFNGGDVLGECLDSLLAQTMRDIEVIVIDDGSTDDTEAVCDRYSASDSRIRIVRQLNGGVSSARNAGLDISTGEYLAFADADDVVPQQGIERLFDIAMAEAADFVVGGYLVESGCTVRAVQPVDCSTPGDLLCSFLTGLNHSAFWNKLVRRSALGDARFPEGINYAEDQILLVRMLISRTCRFAVLKEPVYSHRLSAGSATGSGGRSLFELLEAKLIIGNMLIDHGLKENSRECFIKGAEKAVVSVARNIDATLNTEAKKHLLKYAGQMKAIGLPIRISTRAGLIILLARLPRLGWKYLLAAMQMAGRRRVEKQL